MSPTTGHRRAIRTLQSLIMNVLLNDWLLSLLLLLHAATIHILLRQPGRPYYVAAETDADV